MGGFGRPSLSYVSKYFGVWGGAPIQTNRRRQPYFQQPDANAAIPILYLLQGWSALGLRIFLTIESIL